MQISKNSRLKDHYNSTRKLIRFGLVSLFNGRSTLVDHLIPKIFSQKRSSGTIWPIAGRIRVFIPFPKGICPKGNVIARLEFELAYYDSAVHRFNHYTTRTNFFVALVLLLFLHIQMVFNSCYRTLITLFNIKNLLVVNAVVILNITYFLAHS